MNRCPTLAWMLSHHHKWSKRQAQLFMAGVMSFAEAGKYPLPDE